MLFRSVTGMKSHSKGSKQDSREDKLAKLVNRICEEICVVYPQLSHLKRDWTSYFHTKSPKNKNSKMPQKPDLVNIDKGAHVEDFRKKEQMDWSKVKVVAEEKEPAYKDKKFATVVGVDLYNKAYLVIEHQEDRRFVLAFSMTALILDRKSTRLNSSHSGESRMPSSA